MNDHSSMNRVYRLIWSEVRSAWVPVAETARGRGKSGRARSRGARSTAGRNLIAAAISLALAPLAYAGPAAPSLGHAASAASASCVASVCGSASTALSATSHPQGGKVVSGSASITQVGNTTDVRQSSEDVSIDWLSFSIGAQSSVDFIQPSASAVAVNRISGTNGSEILGHLDANGQVYLINPNGILFGKGAEVNVGGLVASTLEATGSGGSSRSFSGSSIGSIVNEGTITAANGGYVALIGNRVSNEGVITAQLGTVALGSGSAVTLDFSGDRLVHLQVDQSTLNDLAENKQLIQADGGLVIMTAGAQRSLLASVVNNSGVIEARTVENHGGTIELLGGMSAGTVQVGGTLDASAPQGGNGGFIETNAAHVEVANTAKVTTASTQGLTGSWLIDPEDFTVAPTGGDITGATLSKELGTSSVTLESSAGTQAPSGSGNVNIDDAVSWSASTRLTLIAANNVNVNKNITATGATAVLFIKPDTANGSEQASGTGSFDLQAGTSITLSGANAGLWITTPSYTLGTGAQINLANVSPTSTTALFIGATDYTVINSLGAAGSATGTDLQGIEGKLSGHYALGSNINAAATATWNSNGAATPVYAGFTPIGSAAAPFTGTLEGLGHTLTGLSIDLPTTSDVGLIGKSGKTAVVQNVGLIGGSVSGASYVGALVGQSGGVVSNSYATGSVAGVSVVGGLVGQSDAAISNSYATGSVAGTGNGVGGLAGQSDAAISNSYATGSVAGSDEEVGGLLGKNLGALSNSYATGNVNGVIDVGGLVGYEIGSASAISTSYAKGGVSRSGSYVGGLVGHNTGTAGGVTASYWDETSSGQSASAGGTGLTAAQMQTAGNFAGFNFTSTPDASGNNWVMVDINGSLNNASGAAGAIFPMLASEYTTRIDNAHQLQLMAMNPAAAYFLSQNIDASTTGTGTDVWGSAGFIPIGGTSAGFTGTLDGLGHTVSNLTIDLPSNTYVGLIGLAGPGSVIEELGIVGGSITGSSIVGALVGQSAYGTVSYAYATANVHGSEKNIGGLIGNNYGTVNESYATGDVTGNGYVGGLVGRNQGQISGSYAKGQVTGAGNFVGGLVGYNTSGISNSYATGNVSDAANDVGGLVGYSSGGISNSNASGGVTGTQAAGNGNVITGDNVGGLVGVNVGTVSYGDAVGSVSATGFVGGLIGANTGTVSNSYATGQVTGTVKADSGDGNAVGGLVGYSSGTISTSHAIGSVSGAGYVGGLVGQSARGNTSTINTSYASGSVNGLYIIGGLVGDNEGTVSDSHASGSVGGGNDVGGLAGRSGGTVNTSYATGGVTGNYYVGGLMGWSQGSISGSYASGKVTGGSEAYLPGGVGGLVGYSSGSISTSYATGSVSGSNYVGGLVGEGSGTIKGSHAEGSVSGSNYVGGLVGEGGGTISSSYATGQVTGTGNDVGGLVGSSGGGTISSSYATGQVTGTGNDVGGLVGSSGVGTISTSYASGAVTGAGNNVGGLVGDNTATLVNNYATGKVSAGNDAGGLVGLNSGTGTVATSYSTGTVSGSSEVGGLVGGDTSAGSISASFWNVTTSGLTTSAGAGASGLTTAQMENVANFTTATSANGYINPNWNFTTIWYMPSGSYPLLRVFMTPPAVTAN